MASNIITSYAPFLTTVLASFCLMNSLESKDFGIQGELFAIEEENVMIVLQKQLSSTFSDGTLKELYKRAEEKAKQPTVIKHLPSAKEPRLFYYDPTYVSPENITDTKGNIIVAKNSKFNPLKQVHLSSGLLFLDGDNRDQIKWAQKQEGSYKWILVQGNPFELEIQEKRPVYFDQSAFSITKLGIKHLPAKVTQEDLRLKIEEVVLEDMEDEG